MKTRDTIILVGVAVLGVLVATGNLQGIFSGAMPDGEEEPGDDVRTGTSADLSIASFDQAADTSTQTAADNYAWRDNDERIYLGSNDGSSSSRTSYSNFVIGDSFQAVAFNSGEDFDYGTPVSGAVDSENELKNLDVWKGAGTGDLTAEIYNDGSTTTDISTLGSGEQAAIDYLKLKLDASNKAYNPSVVAFKLPSGTNISSIDMPDAESVEVPDSLGTDYDYAFKLSSVTVGGESVSVPSREPVMSEWDSMQTGKVVFEADSDGTIGETVTVAYLDHAPFIDTTDELAYGVEDDTSSPSDVGVEKKTDTLTV